MKPPHPRKRQPPGRAQVPAGLSLLIPLLVGLPVQAQINALDFPSRGVICDRASRTCYDRNGVSFELTGRQFGKRAQRDVERRLAGTPIPREIRFSSGDVCDLQRQTCWSNTWRRSSVNEQLSRQLFGRGYQAGTSSTGWGDSGRPNQPVRTSTYCDLSQRGRRLFSGPCTLSQRAGGQGTTYRVELADGRSYSFLNRQGQLAISDSTGTWPVASSGQGNAVAFRWSDLQLLAGTNASIGSGTINPPVGGNTTSWMLQELINGLFR